MLWVDGAETAALRRLGLDEREYAERRSQFAQMRHVTVEQAGHMLHHDQPEAVAKLIEEFLVH